MTVVPRVSVIVPVYNGAETIGACLEALVAQDYPKDQLEILVVDNKSTDETARVVARYPVRCVREDQAQSSYAARNRGVGEASGELLAFTDADCVPARDWLRRGVAAFADARIGGVAGEIQPLPPQTIAQRYAVEKRALSQEGALRQNSYRPAVYTANAFYRKRALEQAGLFDPSVKSGGDADLAWRVQERLGLTLAYCPEAVVYHEHRRRVRDLLKQRRNYGYGSVVNYVKHRQQMGRRTLRQAWWELASLGRRLGRFAGALGRWACSGGCSGVWRERTAIEGLDVLAFCAKKLGQWHAALRYRVWYL